jgi:hypothetical protein
MSGARVRAGTVGTVGNVARRVPELRPAHPPVLAPRTPRRRRYTFVR